jgi:D-glycero-alpha-D-manno-heptose-7-phosphate kinase
VIISSAPLRISFCGGGTDYRSYFSNYGGGVLGAAIDKRVYVFINPLSKFSEENIRFTYRVTESVNTIDAIEHPVVRAALAEMEISNKINIATMADVPGNSGLGSSSAFTVALIGGLAKFKGINLGTNEIVKLAYKIEREVLKEAGGVQDFLHASFGSFRYYEIAENGSTNTINLWHQDLVDLFEKRVVLIRIGESRESAVYAKITDDAVNQIQSLQALHKNMEITKKTKDTILSSKDAKYKYSQIVSAVNENWVNKKIFQGGDLPEEIERFESNFRPHGLSAMKLCGAGTSGYLLAFFEESVPFHKINAEDLLDFKLEEMGLKLQIL